MSLRQSNLFDHHLRRQRSALSVRVSARDKIGRLVFAATLNNFQSYCLDDRDSGQRRTQGREDGRTKLDTILTSVSIVMVTVLWTALTHPSDQPTATPKNRLNPT
ncbi:hypothetical protein TcWFU_005655 [Taenia crassiceps]|uniref:Uncharacterized protein n=1 Tax=Taenia crassiceps TaxID=6207 RepID=A0ABR4QRZ4_9CEST